VATEKEKRVIDIARLVTLGWLGDSIDGGKAMRAAIAQLEEAIEALDGTGTDPPPSHPTTDVDSQDELPPDSED
jgi:hypothetical protein